MAKEIYFGHSFALAHSPGMFYIISHGGVKAYGQVFMLIEMLGNDNNAIDLKNKPLAYMIAKRLECEVGDLNDLIAVFVESGLFDLDDGILSSRIVAEAYRRMEEKTENAKQNAAKRWEKEKGSGNANACQTMQNNATACEGNASACDSNATAHSGNANVCKPMLIKNKNKKEIEKEKGKEDKTTPRTPQGGDTGVVISKPDPKVALSIISEYNKLLGHIKPKPDIEITPVLICRINWLISEYKIEKIMHVLKKVVKSDWLVSSNFICLDWIVHPENFYKILSGKYDENKHKRKTRYEQQMEELERGIAEEKAKMEGERPDEQTGNARTAENNNFNLPEG